MYLCFQKHNLAVADFQLLYDTDNFIQLDFYAEGLLKEPLLYDNPIFAEKITSGFIKSSYEDYLANEKIYKATIRNQEWVESTSIKMVNSIIRLHKLTRLIEKDLTEEQLSLNLWKDYFSAIAIVMQFKRFTEDCEPTWFTEDVDLYENQIKEIHVPSHILLFHKKLDGVKKERTEREIKNFIHLYGFLYDFNIALTPFEDEGQIRELISKSTTQIRAIKPPQRINHSFSTKLYKRMAWYEEMRHYYQARALRNYRTVFEKLNLDIFETGIEEFHRHLGKEGL